MNTESFPISEKAVRFLPRKRKQDTVLVRHVGAAQGFGNMAWYDDSSGNSQYPIFDPSGNTQQARNASNQVTQDQLLNAFGQLESVNVGNTDPTMTFLSQQGGWRDPNTGLIYLRARWYDPSIKRFISKDPLGPMNDPNPYRYAGNNPVNGVDPSGLATTPWMDQNVRQQTEHFLAMSETQRAGLFARLYELPQSQVFQLYRRAYVDSTSQHPVHDSYELKNFYGLVEDLQNIVKGWGTNPMSINTREHGRPFQRFLKQNQLNAAWNLIQEHRLAQAEHIIEQGAISLYDIAKHNPVMHALFESPDTSGHAKARGHSRMLSPAGHSKHTSVLIEFTRSRSHTPHSSVTAHKITEFIPEKALGGAKAMAKALKLHGNERLAAGLSVLESGTTAWQEAQRGEYGRAAFHATKALVEAPKTFKVLELTRAGKALLWIGERGNLFLLIIDTPGNIKTDIVGTARAIHLTGDIVYQIVQLWNNIWNNMVKGRESYLKEVNTQSKQFEHLTKDAGIYGSWPWIFGG